MKEQHGTRVARGGITLELPAGSERPLSAASLRAAVGSLVDLLDERSRRIVTHRFGLGDGRPQTLHAIGLAEGVTRERIRQIEQSAIRKFQAHRGALVSRDATAQVLDAAEGLLRALGGAAREDIMSELLQLHGPPDEAALRLLLRVCPGVADTRETQRYVRHYRLSGEVAVDRVLDGARTILTEQKRLLPDEEFLAVVRTRAALTVSDAALRSILSVSRLIVRTPFGEWGLHGWAEATPRGVGDKSYIVLKRAGQPLHFVAIAEGINAARFDRRLAHAQTVHNELIRDERFVLVGRGLYALREWGYQPGTVADVLRRILRRAPHSMPREELVDEVLKERLVKRNTVLLALQDRSQFVRTVDGRYTVVEGARSDGGDTNHAEGAEHAAPVGASQEAAETSATPGSLGGLTSAPEDTTRAGR